ncbi:helicase [Coemansia sp. RSA 1200]|nr:helicase [Coemansia sp. RSA 1200]
MAAGGNGSSGKKKGKKQQQQQVEEEAAAGGGSANTLAQPSASQQLFGKWTGKTPVTLLNEHVQRNAGWQRPDYNMRGSSSGSGFHCVVRMTKIDAKSSSSKAGPSTETVAFEPTETKSRPLRHPTALEARHTAATYALHRLRSATSMHLMLPPVFRTYWLELEDQRKELQLTKKKKDANDMGDWKYAADPFAAKAARTREREVKEEERTRTKERERRAVALGRSEDLMRPGMRRRWEELAEVHMSEDNRQAVEAVVRTWTRSWALDEEEGEREETNNEKEEPGARNKLLALGFRRAHVAEALTHAGTMQEALDWLCVHIPEDDLPDQVLRRSYRAAPAIVAPAVDADGSTHRERTAAAVGAAAKRLARSGFAESVCRGAVAECLAHAPTVAAAEALAAFRLHRQLCGRAAEPGTAADNAQLREAVAEEIEALEAIYAGEVRVERLPDNEVHRVSVALRPEITGVDGAEDGDAVRVPTDARLEFWFPPRLDYPHTQTPAITVASTQLPAYLKQHVARKLDALVKCDGLPVMFEAVSAVDSALQMWLATPPLLAELHPRKTKLPAQPQQPKQQSSSRPVSTRYQPVLPPSPGSVLTPPDTPAYRALQQERAQLPAARMEHQIAELVASNTCTVIAGATGCGKTTQVPQFILDHGLRQGRHVSIICTQPRRISAVGVATRVAAERGESGGEICGGIVGYAVRGETRRSAATRLLFCTTGVLLQMLRDAGGLDGVTHVVCDEVHERSVDSDLALALLRAAVQGNRNSSLRVVLMSATAQGDSFARYFGARTPVVSIPGRTFPVADMYLEDFMQEVGGSKPASGSASALSIDYAMACRVVEHIHASAPLERAVLVFMPGAAEIRSCIGALSRSACADALHVLPLHSALAAGEQRRVFGAPPRGLRKVVVATNVAETGITVADIGFVVDAGRARVVRFDHRTRIARLTTVFCSQAAATQRRGRAGRVREGVCYRLYTRETEQQMMPPHEDPEIRRAPLEQACLRAKAVGYDDAAALLAQMLDPPESAAIDSAQTLLVAVGACDAPQGQLTALGRLMAQLPLDLRLAKMLVVGALLGALDAALPLVALMSLDRPLVASGSMSTTASPSQDSKDLRTHCAPPLARSDWIADLAVYLRCASSNSKGDGSSSRSANLPPGVSSAAIREVKRSIKTLHQCIEQTGLVSAKRNQMQRPNRSVFSGLDDIMVLKAIILAALSPNIARVRLPPQKYQEMISGTVGVAHQARELAFYAPADPFAHVSSGTASAGVWATHDKRTDQRLFIHPQSTMFAEPKYPVPFITYLSLSSVESAPTRAGIGSSSSSSKVYVRDVTVPGIYALLLLGPPLTVDHDNKVVSIGGSGALAVRAWPRIAVLVNRLRKLMDELLRRKLDDPESVALESHPVIGAVLQLIRSDGQ